MHKHKYILITILALILLVEPIYEYVYLNTNSKQFENQEVDIDKKITIYFRNDDLSYNSDIQKESELIEIFKKYNVKPIYAIIPFVHGKPLGENKENTDSLKSWIANGYIVPAMHGYEHKRNRYNAGEFAELPYEEQYQMINTGKRYLDSLLNININIFAPPWNHIDENSLKALLDNNINILTSYLFEPYEKGMYYLNSTSNFFDLESSHLGKFDDVYKFVISSKFNSEHTFLFHSSFDINDNTIIYIDSVLNFLSKSPLVSFGNFNNLNDFKYTPQEIFISKQLQYIETKYNEFRIFKFILMKIGLDQRPYYRVKLRESVWSGDLEKQFEVIKTYTYNTLFLLSFNRIIIVVIIWQLIVFLRKKIIR